MTKLMAKEIKLAASPLSFIFIAASLLTMVPGYPILVGTFFICLGIFYSFQNAREANDVIYSVLLPVKKTDYVMAKYMFTAMIQIVSLVLISALTVLRMTVFSDTEVYRLNALMNATPLYLAFVLLIFASFNVFFLGGLFKTGWKIGIPFLKFGIAAFILVFVGEAVHFFPGLSSINAPEGKMLPLQFALLAASAALYVISTLVSRRISMRRFERIDL